MLRIGISVDDGDDEELDRLTGQLRRELLESGLDDVRRAAPESPPAGAKGDPITIGALVIGLAGSAAVSALVTGVCQIIRSWVIRGRERTVIVEIDGRRLELKGATSDQHQQAIDAFVRSLDGSPAVDRGTDDR